MEKLRKWNNKKLKEAGSISTEKQVADTIFYSLKFSMKAVVDAYDVYTRINKICGKEPIPAYQFKGDTTNKTALIDKTWINMFFNSALFTMLNVDSLRSFVEEALDNSKLRDDFMKLVYMKRPTKLEQLIFFANQVK
jgi:hypothetical protein